MAVYLHSIMSERALQRTLDLFDHESDGRGLSAVDAAYDAGLFATRRLDRTEQKRLGQFMTPVPIGRFMAERAVADLAGDTIRILDPAAGSGVLGVAAVEALLERAKPPGRIELLCCEIDVRLHSALEAACEQLRGQCAAMGVELDVQVQGGDFLLSRLAVARQPCVDLVIANPPYFKLGKADPRAQAHAYAVHGQPNIYGLFMAACASLVRPNGAWCFITPRSWTGGDYFGAVRRHVFERLNLSAAHTFESRTEHFGDDEVLQEAVIAWARAGVRCPQIEIGSSGGAHDLRPEVTRRVDVDRVLSRTDGHRLRLPQVSVGIEQLADSLDKLRLRVFTGPVVAFRAKRWLAAEAGRETVPMLWMQHVQRMAIRWPLNRKLEHIRATPESHWMLVQNRVMVLLRRFSPKEDVRRVTATPYLAHLPGDLIGLENHLNCITTVDRDMSASEAIGLAAYLNSRPVDEYLRTMCGHTQINASDLRRMPFPDHASLVTLGDAVGHLPSLARVDKAVELILADPFTVPSAA
jgi:adenine-specific DNA-methyltransferase